MRFRKWFEKDGLVSRCWNSWHVGAPLWLIAAGLLVFWFFCVPAPGYAIGALGAVAGIVSLRDIKVLGKISWIALLVLLLVTEFRAIRRDRVESANELIRQRKDQDTRFQDVLTAQNNDFAATAKTLEAAYKQNQREFSATMGGISKEIGTFTGGHSYLVFYYVPGEEFLLFSQKGQYSVFHARAKIADLDRPFGPGGFPGAVINVGEVPRGRSALENVPPVLDKTGNEANFNIEFTARNGGWNEQLRARRKKDGWTYAIRVQGIFSDLKKSTVVCESIDKDFPTESLDKDFNAFPRNPKLPPCFP